MARLVSTLGVVALAVGSFSTVAPVRAANRIVVGMASATCTNPQFSTIQAAVDAASPGEIIQICAGTYSEQVRISKPLSLRGQNGVVIEPSSVVANATGLASGQSLAAIILVENTTDVNIQGVIVDGANSGIAACSPDFLGIYYANASGDVDRVAVRNVKLAAGLNGCQSGSAILVQSGSGGTSLVTVENSSVHDYQKNGITANESGTQVQIDHNVITGVGATTGAAQNGIQVGFGAAGSVTRNELANHIWSPCVSESQCDTVSIGILVTGSDGVTLERNIVGVSQVGIAINANHAEVSHNRVFGSQVADGIELIGDDNTADTNRIVHSDRAGIFVAGNNNVVGDNAIEEAVFGVLKQNGSVGNVIGHNTFFDAIVTVQDPTTAPSKASPYR